MKHCMRLALLPVALLTAGLADEPWQQDRKDVKLPNGKSQQEEILKADHQKTLRDSAALLELVESLKKELEKNEHHVLSISSIRKTEEIEKLAKRIRSRLRRY